jgi:hypothetical protein
MTLHYSNVRRQSIEQLVTAPQQVCLSASDIGNFMNNYYQQQQQQQLQQHHLQQPVTNTTTTTYRQLSTRKILSEELFKNKNLPPLPTSNKRSSPPSTPVTNPHQQFPLPPKIPTNTRRKSSSELALQSPSDEYLQTRRLSKQSKSVTFRLNRQNDIANITNETQWI